MTGEAKERNRGGPANYMTAEQWAQMRRYVNKRIDRAKRRPASPTPKWAQAIYDERSKPVIDRVVQAVKTDDCMRIASAYRNARDWRVLGAVPPLTRKHRKAIIKHIQARQDSTTGLFKDPKSHEGLLGALAYWGGRPLHRVAWPDIRQMIAKGPKGLQPLDTARYLQRCKSDSDWAKGGWGVGSHMGSQSHAILKAIDHGQTELIPVLEEGVSSILSYQDPESGLWGPPSADIRWRISGNVKVLGRMCNYMGMAVPRVEPLIDTLIEESKAGSWKHDLKSNLCPMRNVVEVVAICLEVSEYRRQELYDVLEESAEQLGRTWNDEFQQAVIIYSVGIAGDYLNWKDFKLPNPMRVGLPTFSRGAAHKYRIEIQADGKVKVVKKKPEEFVWHPNYKGL